MNKIKAVIQKAFNTGFVAVVGSSTLAKVVTLFGGIIFVRVLSKEDYGTYTYVNNAFTLLILLSDFGTANAFMQFASENHDNVLKKDAYFKYMFKRGLIFSSVTSMLVLFSPIVYPYINDYTAFLTASLFLIPFINTLQMYINAVLRSSLENNKFARFNLFSSVIYYLVILPAGLIFGVTGAVFAKYIITLSTVAFGAFLSKGLFHFKGDEKLLTKQDKNDFNKLAFATTMHVAVNQLMVVFDVFCIGLFIANTEIVASYKVGTVLPSALLFIPTAVMTYFVPLFARNKEDIKWVKKTYFSIIGVGSIFYGLLTVATIALSPFIVPILFGEQYTDSMSILIILMIGFFFSASLRVPTNNIIYTQRKVNINIIVSVISTALNIVLNIILVPIIGSVGAAIASMAVMVVSSIILFVSLMLILKNK